MFAVSEGNARQFVDSVEKAGTRMYPQYQWRALPDDHWAYTIHAPVKGRKPALRGLSNGVRELMVLSAGNDLSETFQKRDVKQTGEFATATNLYFYASEMNRPRPRLESHATRFAAAAPTRKSVMIVRASHPGNWNPEPKALEVFAGVMADRLGIGIKMVDGPLATIHQIVPAPDLVIVSGIEEPAFDEAQLAAIKAYVEANGVVLFETPGGRGNFTASAEKTVGEIFGKPVESVLRTRIISGDGLANARNLGRVDYRPFALQAFGTRETAPRLRGMIVKPGGQPHVLFSREDITHALLGQPCWGISGYSTQSARELMANIVLHATTK